MVRPRGETHHSASLTLKKASAIKKKVAGGASVSTISAKYELPYQLIYRLVRGKTWPEAVPKGDVLGETARESPGRKSTVTIGKQYALWKKRREGVGTKELAAGAELSASSVRRLVAEFEMLVAIRVSRLQLTSGSYDGAIRRYGITEAEAVAMDGRATASEVPARLERIAERDLPRLEKVLNGKKR